MTRHSDPRVGALVAWYETLTPQTLPSLHALYAANAHFKDPFNDVQGTAAIERVFRHMFATLQSPRFSVGAVAAESDTCMLIWRFDFASPSSGRPHCIRGATHIAFDRDGRVSLHRDYWDAAEELYETVPVLGSLMRWLKRRLRAH